MSMRKTLGLGASLGARLALVYGLIFVAVAVIRYGLDLWAAPPGGSFWSNYVGGAVSLAVASLGITAIMALLAAVLGSVTALCAFALYWLVNRNRTSAQPPAIGVGVAIFFVLLLHIALGQMGLWTWSSLLDTTYLFWLGIPALVYVIAALVTSRTWRPQMAQQMSA